MGRRCIRAIKYTSGYKYQLHEDYQTPTDIRPEKAIETDYITLGLDGYLVIKKGYAWDGPSGPTFDTLNFMRGSLGHDALYQLMRMGLLSRSWKGVVDQMLHTVCRADGMGAIRAWWVLRGVTIGGHGSTDPANRKTVHTAPKINLAPCERSV